MNTKLLNLLECTSCRCSYKISIFNQIADSVESAVLTCPRCQLVVPVCHGLPLFAESRPKPSGSLEDWLEKISKELFGEAGEYASFLKVKSERKVTDLYAAFQPFNESTRSIYPFINILRESLKPGDVILDTWCRTGWSGELLAGLFPEQHVISIWEGDSNVLGYRGFEYWLGTSKRHANLDIIFAHPDYPLPFATNSVAFVHGLDSIHRYRHASYIPEVLRICRDDGILLFPHIHLSNSEPDPFFERGCKQYHGKDWKNWLNSLIANSTREAWVLSEVELFEMQQQCILKDDANTVHYNGLILIAPTTINSSYLQAIQNLPITANSRFIENPLLDIAVHRCEVSKSNSGLSGLANELLIRHPCYADKLATIADGPITGDESRFIWHAENILTLQEIANEMAITLSDAEKIARNLCEREILHASPITYSMAALQRFYGKSILPVAQPNTFTDIWLTAKDLYHDAPLIHWLEDDSQISYEDADYVIDCIRRRFIDLELSEGDRIAIASPHHPESLFICWAAWLSGITLVAIDKELPVKSIIDLIQRTKSKLLVTDQHALANQQQVAVVFLDNETSPPNDSICFADWLDATVCPEAHQYSINPENIATILFTSGSTGLPKGVMLSQQALAISGKNMADTHGWKSESILSLGPFSMMSGLRNPAVASLSSGSTVLLPGRSTLHHPWISWQQAQNQNATVITAVPAWLQIVVSNPELTPCHSMKHILLTGAYLSPELRLKAIEKLSCGIGNYYGLTETGGLCATQLPDDLIVGDTIGIPAGALLQIIDDNDMPVSNGETGMLRCLSKQLMTGYLDNQQATANVLINGWFWTGDKASWDKYGRIKLHGRNDDFIKLRNGALFNPNEVESLIMQINGVDDVALAIDAQSMRITAILVSERHIDEICVDFNTEYKDNLEAYKFPEKWIKADILPKNTNGKLIRKALFAIIDNHN